MALDFLSTYYWRVRAIDADGQCCPWSAIHSFTVASGEIASGTMVPSNDTTTAQSTSTPTLGWVGPEGAVSYEVAFGLSTGSLETAIATEAAYTFAVPLPEATVYWWRVRAIDGIGGAGAWSTFSSFKSK
jgi:predicted phage tail protein